MSDTTSEKRARPLSPHLQVYKLPYNARMSIIGRAVGIALSGVVSLLLIWFVAVVWNPDLYEVTMSFLEVIPTRYALLLLAFATFFYLGNGVRHVLWDFVIGVLPKSGVMTGNIVLVLSVLLTLGLWAVSNGSADGLSFEKSMQLAAQTLEGEE